MNRLLVVGALFLAAVVAPASNTLISHADSISSTVTVEGSGSGPFEIAVHSASNVALVTNQNAFSVSRIRTTDFTTVATITVGLNPRGIVIDSTGQYAYVASFGSNKIWRINLSTNTATAWATVGSRPYGIAITSDDAYLYVSNDGSSTVSKVDTSTAAVSNINVGSYPRSIAISADGSKVIVVREGGADSVVIINTTTNATSTHGVYSFPNKVIASTDSQFAYVGNTRSIMKLDLRTGQIESSISVAGTDGMVIDPSGRYIYGSESFFYDTIGVERHYFIYKYALEQGRLVEKIRVGAGPYGLAFAGSSGKILTANSRTNTVSVVSMQDKYDQTITFNPDSSMYFKLSGIVQQMPLTANSSSGLSVGLSVSTPSICEIVNGNLIPRSTGTCTVEANQQGNAIWNQAPVTARSVSIKSDPYPNVANPPSTPTMGESGSTVTPTSIPWSLSTIPNRSLVPQISTPIAVPVPSVVPPDSSLNSLSTTNSKIGKSVTANTLKKIASISTPSTSKISLSVLSSSKAICRASGSAVKMLKKGSCQVVVTVIPKKGMKTSKSVTIFVG